MKPINITVIQLLRLEPSSFRFISSCIGKTASRSNTFVGVSRLKLCIPCWRYGGYRISCIPERECGECIPRSPNIFYRVYITRFSLVTHNYTDVMHDYYYSNRIWCKKLWYRPRTLLHDYAITKWIFQSHGHRASISDRLLRLLRWPILVRNKNM